MSEVDDLLDLPESQDESPEFEAAPDTRQSFVRIVDFLRQQQQQQQLDDPLIRNRMRKVEKYVQQREAESELNQRGTFYKKSA